MWLNLLNLAYPIEWFHVEYLPLLVHNHGNHLELKLIYILRFVALKVGVSCLVTDGLLIVIAVVIRILRGIVFLESDWTGDFVSVLSYELDLEISILFIFLRAVHNIFDDDVFQSLFSVVFFIEMTGGFKQHNLQFCLVGVN